jgi:hypothetical protein
MMIRKITMMFVLCLLAFVALGTQTKAATTGDIDGSFTSSGYNNQTVIHEGSIKIYDVNNLDPTGTGTLTTSLTPNTEYYLTFTVSDLDMFEDVSLDMYLAYVEGYNLESTDQDIIDASGLITDSVPEGLHITWSSTYVDGVYSSELFGLEFNGAVTTTWELDPSVTVGETPVTLSSVSTAQSVNTRDFKVYFKTSKVAPFSNTGEWGVVVKTTDSILSVETPQVQYEVEANYSMQFYGEVNLDLTSDINWENVYPGLKYSDAEAKETVSNLRYLSNSDYDTIVKSSEIWAQITGSIVEDATLTDDALDNNTFSIVAAAQSTWTSDLSSNGQIGFLQTKAIGDYHIRTSEEYDVVTLYLYLKTSPQFQNGYYLGSITFGITNHL